MPKYLGAFPAFCPPFPSLHLEVGPLNAAKGLGERCKLPQRGLGRSPSGNRILCIFAIKSYICSRQIYYFFSANQLTTVRLNLEGLRPRVAPASVEAPLARVVATM